MHIASILTVERTLCQAPAVDKQQALVACAQFFERNTAGLSADTLLQSLLARERLGSTGLGNGIAIPHCRLKNIDTVLGSLVTLETPIDFDAIDNQPVDILFVLLAPERALQEHLNTLAALAGLLNQAEFRQNLRTARNADELYRAAVGFRE